MLLAMPTTV
uniref:Uncharacterized protein n=1 Tax=Arundo donax TaxID=35708 RepID=A0A0A9AXC9_ARUDO